MNTKISLQLRNKLQTVFPMSRHTLHLLGGLSKLSLVGAGVAASIYATVKSVKAAGANKGNLEENEVRVNFPCADYPPFRKWNKNWDRMEPGMTSASWLIDPRDTTNRNASKGESKVCGNQDSIMVPVARRNIILVRHGQYNIDENDDDSKQTLTNLGEEQAALVGQRLSNMGVKFNSITSSAMTRAIQTACIILKNMDQKDLKLEVNDPLLSEGPPCIPEPSYRRPELWNPSERVSKDIMVEGARIEAGFRKYFYRAEPSQKEDSWEVIVCHGNVIRYFTCRALQFPPEGWIRMSIDHTSITRFCILPSGEVILRGFGDSGHIPPEKDSVV